MYVKILLNKKIGDDTMLKCKITKKEIAEEKNEIIKHLTENFCKEEQTLGEFIDIYNDFIKEQNLILEEYEITPCTYRQDFHRTGTNLIWKPGSKFRYYPLGEYDYENFLESLNLKTGEHNATYVFEMNKNIMQKYDIRDGFELHNILRRLYKEEITFKNIPIFII